MKKSGLQQCLSNGSVTAKGGRTAWVAAVTTLASTFVGMTAGCSNVELTATKPRTEITAENLVKPGIQAEQVIGDETTQFSVTTKEILGNRVKVNEGALINSDELILGLPFSLLGKENLFGAVITQVSDRESDDLGRLKLTDLPPLHVVPKLVKTADGTVLLALFGCVSKCQPGDDSTMLLTFPVIGLDTENERVLLDLAAVGEGLDLLTMLDPDGEATHLKTKQAMTTSVDFSQSTLVFDVESHMEPVEAPTDGTTPVETVFTTRWYLKLNSVDPQFVKRTPIDAVGFFTTDRGAETQITRFSTDAGPVHYFLKDIPEEFRASFAASFDSWNEVMRDQLGKDVLTYEFVEATDPRSALLVPGDVRYNIVSWDLVNQAPYGGLGPSIADQLTGQTFNANVLVQGPSIVSLYKRWFAATEEARVLVALGKPAAAEQVLVEAKRELGTRSKLSQSPLALKLGKHLNFRVVSQMPSLQDPIMQRDDFEALPEGQTFESYMPGYFQDMITHELGHNLGLRHNFRGTLGGETVPTLARVSRSIMDYMNRNFRYLDRVGEYDHMAVAFGYQGKAPSHADWFCTDEHVAGAESLDNSAECSRDDATNDPFSYFESMLTRQINLLIGRGQTSAPTWGIADMDTQLKASIHGMLNYAASAKATAATWTNFFFKPGRPETAEGVSAYVATQFKAQLCDASIDEAIALKTSDEAKAAATINVVTLRLLVGLMAENYANLKGFSELIACARAE